MKTAVIFYSYEGDCALIAEKLAGALKADVFRIKTLDTKQRKGFAKYMWGGFQVTFGKKPPLQPLTVDVNAYDLIVLGTPVWAGSPAPAISSFLSGTKINGKKIAFYCCHAGGKRNVFSKLKAMLPGNTFSGEIDFINPAQKEIPDLDATLGKWVKTIGV